jgi:uroporphyrinogen III methyltransferase/synthase
VAFCYRNVSDASRIEEVREELARGAVDWITFTSSSTVTNFVNAFGKEVLLSQREKFRVACIGPVTEKTARENGLLPDVVASQADIASLVQAIQSGESNISL